MTKMTSDMGSFTFAYDSLGRRIKRNLPDDTVTSYSYDPLSRLINITHKNAFQHTIDSFGYTYDNVGNRTAKKDNQQIHPLQLRPNLPVNQSNSTKSSWL